MEKHGFAPTQTETIAAEGPVIDYLGLCKTIATVTSKMKDQAQLIDRTISRVRKKPEYKGCMLVLVDPVTKPPDDYVEWTVVSPHRDELREVVTDRIQRGYLPIGVLDPNGPKLDVFVDTVPSPYRRDFMQFAQIEAQLVYRTMTGRLSQELGTMSYGVRIRPGTEGTK